MPPSSAPLRPCGWPSVRHLAELFDALRDPAWTVTDLSTVLFLVRQHSELERLWEQMHQPTSLGVRPIDLAGMAIAALGVDGPKLERAALRLVEQTPGAREALASLQRMADDIGGKPTHESWTHGVVGLHGDFDQLLDSEWQDPAEILDPTRELGIDYVKLIRICRARIARAEGAESVVLNRMLDRLLTNYGRIVRPPGRGRE